MKFSESKIYKDGLNLMKMLSDKVKNMSVAVRETIGKNILEHMSDFMVNIDYAKFRKKFAKNHLRIVF